jgi:hypothetical protein
VGKGKQAEHYALIDSKETTAPSQLAGFPHHASTSKKFGGRNPSRVTTSLHLKLCINKKFFVSLIIFIYIKADGHNAHYYLHRENA